MKKTVALIFCLLLVLNMFAACGGKDSSAPQPPTNTENAAQNTENQAEQPTDPAPANNTENTPAAPSVTVSFDSKIYPNTDSNDYYNALAYATNSGDKPAQVKIRYKAFGKDGKVISYFDQFKGRYLEQTTDVLYVPAGARELPIGFILPSGLRYDLSAGKEMPEIDHMEFEVLETADEATEDLAAHFTPGEPEIKNGHIYVYVKFDQEIGDNYASLYPNYTLLGYSNGVLTAVCCKNSFPYGNSSMPVDYAKEKNNSSILVYHDIPNDPVDKWELCLGCIGGRK